MIPGSEGPTTAGSAHDLSDDTIALDLTGEEELALSRAAEAARATARPEESGPVAFRRTARIDFVCNVIFAVTVPWIAVALLWPAPERHPPAPAGARAAPLTAGCACANKNRLRCDGGIRVPDRDRRIRSPRGGCRAAPKPRT